MPAFNLGDKVSVISETISGTIIRLQPNKCVIEDTDGFERIYNLKNIVVTKSIEDYLLDHPRTVALIEQKIDTVAKQQIEKFAKKEINSKVNHQLFNFEIDLHIESLLDDHLGLGNFEIMQIQMQACRMFIEKAIRLNAKKVVLIHGKGEGVLRHEIYSYLDRLENRKHYRFEYFNANNSNYGTDGATEVKIL